MLIFEDLGRRVAKAWCRSRYDNDALPRIAAEELERAPLHKATDYTAIMKWLTTADTLPFQPNVDSAFGEPPITLYWHPTFYIEALFWCSATTAIHGHGFAGAFQVLEGTSVQSVFEFESPETSMRCRIGHLNQKEVGLLRPGTTQTIESGERFVHSVFHLGYPSVTIVVRNRGGGLLQQRYYRPGVALLEDVRFDQLTTRLLQIAILQATLMSPDLKGTVRRIGQDCELAASFRLLQTLRPILFRQNRLDVFGDVLMTLGAGQGLMTISKLSEALTLEDRFRRLKQARESTSDDGLRLFLALLLTQQERPFVLARTSEFTKTDEPTVLIVRWIVELGEMGVLAVPSDEVTRQLLTTWLELGSEAASSAHSESNSAEIIADRKRALLSEPLLAPLLSDSPSTKHAS